MITDVAYFKRETKVVNLSSIESMYSLVTPKLLEWLTKNSIKHTFAQYVDPDTFSPTMKLQIDFHSEQDYIWYLLKWS
jgi:hypothetical protein